MKCAPGSGRFAVIADVERLILPTPPAGWPGTGAVGTATKAVVSSPDTKKLSVAPGRVTDPAALSVVLSTIPSALFEGLNTSVRSFLGLNAIITASDTVPERETRKPR